MRQTLLSIAILSALSLPGLATAEVGPFDTENRVNPPGFTPKGTSPKGEVEENKFPVKPSTRKSPTSTGDQPELQLRQLPPR